MNQLQYAKSFATLHHVIRKGQMYGVVPYTHHLSDVERILVEFGWDGDMLVAAWLHDVVEDTDVKLRDIEENFGENVMRLVGAVTSEKGENRRVCNALTYPKIRESGPDAVALKLADRIANVSAGGGSLGMYKKEYARFRQALYFYDARIDAMWMRLDDIMEWGKSDV